MLCAERPFFGSLGLSRRSKPRFSRNRVKADGNRLGLKPGDRFVVVGEGDVVILKTISPPAMKEFDGLVSKARSQARRAGIKPSDVTAAIRKVRAHR